MSIAFITRTTEKIDSPSEGLVYFIASPVLKK